MAGYGVPEDLDGTLPSIEAAYLERASQWLTDQGYSHRRLRATLTDMASFWR